jgi:hypothetical protein
MQTHNTNVSPSACFSVSKCRTCAIPLGNGALWLVEIGELNATPLTYVISQEEGGISPTVEMKRKHL